MVTLNWKAIFTTFLCVLLTTACSKQLLPPEIETSGSVSEETDLTASSKNNFGASGGKSGGFFSEEPVAENSSSFGSADSNDFGQSGSGNNSNGSFGNNPFDSSGQDEWDPKNSASTRQGSSGPGSSGFGSSDSGSSGFGSSDSGSSGIQESRLQDFQASTKLKDIHFKFDKYDLDGDSRTILKGNAEYLKSNPSLHVEIQGHCDERGTNNYNIALGERRAQSTKQFLVAQGVDSSNVHVISYGEEKPFCFESGETCWFENRRAHFMVSK